MVDASSKLVLPWNRKRDESLAVSQSLDSPSTGCLPVHSYCTRKYISTNTLIASSILNNMDFSFFIRVIEKEYRCSFNDLLFFDEEEKKI